MVVCYADEAGNTGLKDLSQPNLIYGGIAVPVSKWRKLNNDLNACRVKYEGVIKARIGSVNLMGMPMDQVREIMTFFQQFEFHAAEIINGRGLWGKLSKDERWDVLADVIQLLASNDIRYYAASLSKASFKPLASDPHMVEYIKTINGFLSNLHSDLVDTNQNAIIILDDGNEAEKQIFRDCLLSNNFTHIAGELILSHTHEKPLLQLADVATWILQSYQRNGSKANPNVVRLHKLLDPHMRLVCY